MEEQQEVKALTVIEVLQKMDDGGALEDFRDALTEVTKAVEARGGSGSVSLTLKIAKIGRRQLQVVDEVKHTVPKIVKEPTVFFATEEGQLSRQDTNQLMLPPVQPAKPEGE